ncbi:MAG TPA: PSD1 and planctomycete cytochrome C domain-containing protein [Pirellulales bacterium]|jgi:mono/diheme cytochrome c family protein|nr:PSD1 and planctomycete cytochrome C domain-containing protein [Pirellulales bacterium]
MSFPGLAAPAARAETPVAPDHAVKMAEGLALFQTHVRPLLLQNCFKCHGGDSVEANFDMTDRDRLLKGGDSGAVVTIGKSHNSLLYKLIRHSKKPHMPQDAPQLSAAAIASIAEWIDLGAPYDAPLKQAAKAAVAEQAWTKKELPAAARKFWSFQPLHHFDPPPVKNSAWCRTPIDRFILAKMEATGVAPNPPASKPQLIRRLYFDLVGLPPTPEEIAAFVNDPAPDAYEKLVDRLLASPHFGERWGRHWLDLARFAESGGFERDQDRPNAYVYRDFVIRALNEDLPFDTFVRWQLAGDEFEPENPEALAATGFLAAGVHSDQITKSEVERHRYDELDDMLSTTGTAMLGLTIGCARCHDHKYDPILQRDYYQMLSAFTTTVRSEIDVVENPDEYKREKERFDREHEGYVAALRKFEAEKLPARFAEWDKSSNARHAADDGSWLVLEPASLGSREKATFTRLDDGSWLASGANGKFDTYTFVARTSLTGITSIRIEALADPSLVRGGPGRASNGNFDLTDFRVTALPLAEESKSHAGKSATGAASAHPGNPSRQSVALCNPRATFEQPGLPVRATIDADPHSGWAIDPQFGRDQAAVYEATEPLGFPGGTELTFTLQFNGNTQHNIGRLRIAIRKGPPPKELLGPWFAEPVVGALALPAEKRSPQQTAALLAWYRTTDPEWQKLDRAVRDHLAKAPKPQTVRTFLASEGLTPLNTGSTQGDLFFNQTYFLRRGDGNQKMGVAPLGVLQVLDTAPDRERHWEIAPPPGWRTSYRRRAIADWISDTKYGAGDLLARVEVNRLWQFHMGRGIVGTPSDFGARGDRPTHPELLDWLAARFIAAGWHPKAIHRMILTSAAYMQSSASNPADTKADPDDRTFWRRPTQRLEAEVIRDSLLAVGNRLDATMFGHSTLDPESRRRSIYLTVKRSKLIPMLTVFDGPDALGGIGSRATTTVAPQSLYLLNNEQVRACARAMAARIAPTPQASLESAIAAGYMVALGRHPTDGEAADSLGFLKQQIASYEESKGSDARQLALTDLCQALMCLNEFVYVD